jgi:RNA polymerase sigma-70 factor (ECF subfamily)
MDAQEEGALVRRVAGGDREAFRRLLVLHQRPLSAYARRMLGDADLADDMVQETFLRLWARAGRFDPGAARLTTWLHRICHNLCVDSRRRNVRQVTLDDPPELASEGGPQMLQEQADLALRVQRALAALPERQRSALLLCHYQGLSNREAAQILDSSVEALESLLARGRRRLKQELEIRS